MSIFLKPLWNYLAINFFLFRLPRSCIRISHMFAILENCLISDELENVRIFVSIQHLVNFFLSPLSLYLYCTRTIGNSHLRENICFSLVCTYTCIFTYVCRLCYTYLFVIKGLRPIQKLARWMRIPSEVLEFVKL